MNFIFQIGKDNQCAFPFVYAVHDACVQQENDFLRTFEFVEVKELEKLTWCIHEYKNWCPVGSVEFVHEWFRLCGIPIPKPINTPVELFSETGLNPRVVLAKNKNRLLHMPVFIKNMDTIKHHFNGICHDEIPPGNWLVTNYLDDGFIAEYRAFVFKGFVQSIVKYSGAPGIGHNHLEWFVDECIKKWNTSTPAYTIDVGISPLYGPCVIECHGFYSCGTYGWTGYNVLPQMCSSWYFNYTNSNK